MEQFRDQPLRPCPHIAILFYDAIGDFVVATPLMRGLREKYPGCVIDYFGGERTRELEERSALIDARFSVFGGEGGLASLPAFAQEREAAAGPYDLAINLDFHPALALAASLLRPRFVVGRCYDSEQRELLPRSPDKVDALHDEFWASPTLLERYEGILSSQFIGEIFCRLARVETDFHRTEVPESEPPGPVPPILIATGGKRPAKLWPGEYWRELITWCEARGLEVGLLGAAPSRQYTQYNTGAVEEALLRETKLIDLRGAFDLPQVCGALRRARACVTIDNGIMHLAGAVGVPTLALFGAGASPWRVWVPSVPHIKVLLGAEPCPLCEENRFRNADCLRERHVCMESLLPSMAIAALEATLA